MSRHRKSADLMFLFSLTPFCGKPNRSPNWCIIKDVFKRSFFFFNL